MEPMLFAGWLITGFSLLLVGFALFSFRNAIDYAARQYLYQIRDETLVAYAAKGWGPDSEAHQTFRATIHGLIRATHRIGIFLVIAGTISERRARRRGFRVFPNPMMDLLARLPEGEERAFLQEKFQRASVSLALCIFLRWAPVLLPVYLVVAAVLVVLAGIGALKGRLGRLLDRWQRVEMHLLGATGQEGAWKAAA